MERKNTKLAMKKMWIPKTEGGMNLQNIQLYNLACLLKHSLDWITKQSTCTNVEQEQEMMALWDPEAILHTPMSKMPTELKN